MEAFCNTNHTAIVPQMPLELERVKNIFMYAQVIFCFIGVIGNILNLRALQSPFLQTVPFMYIRAMAVFDLIALSLIMFHFLIIGAKTHTTLMYYVAYVEAPLINTFLVAGLYSALFLTVERYFLISRPHIKPIVNPRPLAHKKIGLALLFSFLIHFPMILQRTLKIVNGHYVMANNVDILCREPYWTAYSYYKLGRELLRFASVILLTVLNIIIARQLQLAKMRRRRLVKRSSPPKELSRNPESENAGDNANGIQSSKKEYSNMMRSFTEKKLTVLMIAICIIFILGNVPQTLVMVLQNEAMEMQFGFQVYRYCSNLLEVMNHCLNFYVFCMASSEYTRAFLLNCICLRNILLRFPAIARFLSSRRSSSVMATTSAGFGMANKEYLSMESIPLETAPEWVQDPEDPTRKGILVSGSREQHVRKTLTIVNKRFEEDIDCEDDVEIL